MKRRNKKKHRQKAAAHAGQRAAPPLNDPRRRGRAIWRDLLKGLLFIALVLVIKLLVERTTLGKQLDLMSYNLLQLQLSSEHLPITVVDISDLEPQTFNIDGQTGKATPRAPLRAMIEAIADQQPRAIAIDMDFSPAENRYIHPRDPEFFQFCLDLQKQSGVQVFLGIRRSLTKSPAEWLGDATYQPLAANIIIPNDSKRMVSLIRIENQSNPGVSGEEAQPSRALSVALADAYGREADAAPGLMQRLRSVLIEGLHRIEFIEAMSEKRLRPGLTVEDFLIDFSPLESLKPLRTINPVVLRDQSQRQQFQGKVVLLGDGALNKATDTFVVPAREQPYPGVFLHACAAYTLIKAPLYEVTWKGRLGIDMLFSTVILFTVILIRLYYKNRTEAKVATHRLQGFLTLLVVLIAIIGGVVFVRATRVMWPDFFLALTGVIFHPAIERHLESLWKPVRKHAPAAFQRLLFEQNKEAP
ncbi:MAG: hypothetical protein V7641_5454 [Blastocatellia bacterium]